MAGNNEIAQLLKLLEWMRTKMKEGEKKIELVAATFQTLIKNATKEKGKKPCNNEWKIKKMGSLVIKMGKRDSLNLSTHGSYRAISQRILNV